MWVHEWSWEYTSVHESTCMFMRVHECWEDMRVNQYMKVEESTWNLSYESTRVYSWEYMCVHESTRVFMRVHVCSWEYTSVHGSTRVFMRVHVCSWERTWELISTWKLKKVHEIWQLTKLQNLAKHDGRRPTSFANVVIKASGRAEAINVKACREVLCESAAGDSGSPFEKVGWWPLLSGHNSRSAIRTADTSIYGSQSGKPLPIRSMAARRMEVWDERRGDWDLRRTNMRALLVWKMTRGERSNSPGDNKVRMDNIDG